MIIYETQILWNTLNDIFCMNLQISPYYSKVFKINLAYIFLKMDYMPSLFQIKPVWTQWELSLFCYKQPTNQSRKQCATWLWNTATCRWFFPSHHDINSRKGNVDSLVVSKAVGHLDTDFFKSLTRKTHKKVIIVWSLYSI